MKVLRAVRHPERHDIVRGQYDGYRSEKGVAGNSDVETYAALRFEIDSWRWADVPFFVRTGKRLPVTATEVLATFRARRSACSTSPRRRAPITALPARAGSRRDRARRRIKSPGEAMAGQEIELYACNSHADEMTPYERLLGDAMRGDPTLFARQIPSRSPGTSWTACSERPAG